MISHLLSFPTRRSSDLPWRIASVSPGRLTRAVEVQSRAGFAAEPPTNGSTPLQAAECAHATTGCPNPWSWGCTPHGNDLGVGQSVGQTRSFGGLRSEEHTSELQ